MNSQERLLVHLRANPFVLAPMAGITDLAFRTFMRRLGAGVVITELVSANGLKYQSEKTKKLMDFREDQRPVGIQLFGECPEAVAEGARLAQDLGADFVDLNFGCPVNKVVKKGAGSAILRDLAQMQVMLRTVRSAISIPLTIKVRTGWDAATRNTHEVVRMAHDEGIAWVAIHGRTRAQGYSGQADWAYMTEVCQNSPVPVIANGDVLTANDAVLRLRKSGAAGIMIGRGCLKDPLIFLQSQSLFAGRETVESPSWAELLRGLRFELEQVFDERIVLIQLRKFAAWYSAGYPNSSSFRKLLFEAKSVPELMEPVLLFFAGVASASRMSTENEPFLMGGHG